MSKREEMMIQNRNLGRDLELYPKSEVNRAMKTEPIGEAMKLKSVKGTDVKSI
jgi:hypothetical protein